VENEVTVVSRETGEVRKFNLDTEVYFVSLDKKIPIFHTNSGTFYQIVTLDVFEKWLGTSGFKMLDTVNLVNTNLITEISEDFRTVYFNDDRSLYASTNKGRVIAHDLMHLVRKAKHRDE